MADLKNTDIDDFGTLKIPSGTTVQRPTIVEPGQFRYNTSSGKLELYVDANKSWKEVPYKGVEATGGGTVYDIDIDGTVYRTHIYHATGSQTFSVSKGGQVEYLIVGGGGGGSGNFYDDGGGGGAGGFVSGTTTVTEQDYTIVVGAEQGATGGGGTGGSSSAFGFTANGGGGGGGHRSLGGDGGSGGGGTGWYGGAIPGRSYRGGASNQAANGYGFGNPGGGYESNSGEGAIYPQSGGGGGAGRPGARPETGIGGKGGDGLPSDITGILTYYAGGGGGISAGAGGLGGGADASTGRSGTAALPAVDNTGSGGGGGRNYSGETGLPSRGGNGIAVIRYPIIAEPSTTVDKILSDGIILDLDIANPNVYTGAGNSINDSRNSGQPASIFGSGITYHNKRSHRSYLRWPHASTDVNAAQIQFEHRKEFNYNYQNWCYIIWLRQLQDDNGGWAQFFIQGNDAGNRRPAVWFYSGATSRFHITWNAVGSPGQQTANTADDFLLPINTWYHIAIMSRDRTMGAWRNGIPDPNTIQIDNRNFNNQPLHIGYRGDYRSMGMEIGSFRMFNRSFTDAELTSDYNATRWRYGV